MKYIFPLKNLAERNILRIFASNNINLCMTKRLLSFVFATTLSLIPATMLKAADMPMEAVQQDMSEEITIAVNGQTVTVSGAQGETLEVISLTGRRVLTVKIESPAQRIELNIPKGCYLLKVGKVVRKVSLR